MRSKNIIYNIIFMSVKLLNKYLKYQTEKKIEFISKSMKISIIKYLKIYVFFLN